MIDQVFMNGHLYSVFHNWFGLHKPEANFDVRRFWIEHFDVNIGDYELAWFMADYYNWLTRDCLRKRVDSLSREVDDLNGIND